THLHLDSRRLEAGELGRDRVAAGHEVGERHRPALVGEQLDGRAVGQREHDVGGHDGRARRVVHRHLERAGTLLCRGRPGGGQHAGEEDAADIGNVHGYSLDFFWNCVALSDGLTLYFSMVICSCTWPSTCRVMRCGSITPFTAW